MKQKSHHWLGKISQLFRKKPEESTKMRMRFDIEKVMESEDSIVLECRDSEQQSGIFSLSDEKCVFQRFDHNGLLLSQEELYFYPKKDISVGFVISNIGWEMRFPAYVFHGKDDGKLCRQLDRFLSCHAKRLSVQAQLNAGKPPAIRYRSANDLPEDLREHLQQEFCPCDFPLELWINEKKSLFNRDFKIFAGSPLYLQKKPQRCLLDFFEEQSVRYGETKAKEILLTRCAYERGILDGGPGAL